LPTLHPAAADRWLGQEALPPMNWVGLRSASLMLLAVLAALFALQWARAVVVPVLLGLTFSYALTPIVSALVRCHLPRALSAAVVLLSIVGATAAIGWSIKDDTAALFETLPDVAQKLRQEIGRQRAVGAVSTLEKVQQAAAEIERAAQDSSTRQVGANRTVTRVQIEPTHFNVRDHLWSGTLGLMSGLGQLTVVVFITFFLLASGDTFRRKMVKIAGPTFGQKRLTLEAMDQIDRQIQRYLLVQVLASVLVGVATWLAFEAIGLEHAAVWGALSFVLNFIPYFGSIAVTGVSAVLAFVQFASLEMMLLVAGASLLIHTVSGQILTPWLTARATRMNPVVVFVGVLAWGWLWGLGGLFLGMPILMAVKAVCDRVDDLKPVGELLGD
jgi:predicted PurR-regulated permease PerM